MDFLDIIYNQYSRVAPHGTKPWNHMDSILTRQRVNLIKRKLDQHVDCLNSFIEKYKTTITENQFPIKIERTDYLVIDGYVFLMKQAKRIAERKSRQKEAEDFQFYFESLDMNCDDNFDFFRIGWIIEGRFLEEHPLENWVHPIWKLPRGVYEAYDPSDEVDDLLSDWEFQRRYGINFKSLFGRFFDYASIRI